jgi:sugar fermentation stimulation protein A
MKFPELIPAIFVKRDNRFTAGVRLEVGGVSAAFVPTTGRLTGVLRPGCRVWLAPAADSKRKMPYTLTLAELEDGGLCCTDATMANRLFDEALHQGKLAAFPYSHIENEVPFGRSRLDFRLSDGAETCWVEVKSVTYARDGVGMFPDAPTSRGRKHLRELAKLAAQGDRASAVFIAQRADAVRFTPFEKIDPAFAAALHKAHANGVEVHAYRCEVSLEKIEIAEETPVELSSEMK